ncbi:hypothetical protein C0992_005924 [Termitomyces sp. T32_za158]|nr:hypothetical protein C0992_005924 [Termitomyces sp. T32_za158]
MTPEITEIGLGTLSAITLMAIQRLASTWLKGPVPERGEANRRPSPSLGRVNTSRVSERRMPSRTSHAVRACRIDVDPAALAEQRIAKKAKVAGPNLENPQENIVASTTRDVGEVSDRSDEEGPARKKPPTMAVEAFTFPDPFQETPTDREENPSEQMTQRGDQPHYPAVNSTTFTQTPVPRVVIPLRRLTANLDQKLVDMVTEDPEAYLAVIPFGAGPKLFKDNPTLPTKIALFLEALSIGANNLDVSKAIWKNRPSGRRDFETPWTLILAGASPELKEFLIWQQTFAISPDLTFSVVPFDTNLRSWVITNISGGAVKPGDEARRLALGSLKKALWDSQKFRAISNRMLADTGVAGGPRERAYLATKSFDLTFIESHDTQGNPAPIWQLTAKPMTTDHELHANFKLEVCRTRVMVGLHYLEMEKRLVECAWCKSDAHPAYACQLPKTEDWLGPRPDNAERFKKRTEALRGRGAPPQRGSHARGWTVVQHGTNRGSGSYGGRGFSRGSFRKTEHSNETIQGEYGTRLSGTRGCSAPPAGRQPDDSPRRTEDGQATRGQWEMGSERTSSPTPGDEQRPVAWGAVSEPVPPPAENPVVGVQSVQPPQGAERDGAPLLEQSANRSQSTVGWRFRLGTVPVPE